MREIKFRAWDGENLYMQRGDGLHGLANWLDAHSGLYKDSGKDSILEQFTGLYDKNGKEIYEGDICRAISDEYYSNESFTMDPLDFIGKVEFNSLMWCLKSSDSCFLTLYDYIHGDIELERIGNIHENPELLPSKP